MPEYKGTVGTVGELIRLLEQFPPEKPVRIKSISHEFPPEVHEHERCIILGF